MKNKIYYKDIEKLKSFFKDCKEFSKYSKFEKIKVNNAVHLNNTKLSIGKFSAVTYDGKKYKVHIFAKDDLRSRNTAIVQDTIKTVYGALDKFEINLYLCGIKKKISEYTQSAQMNFREYATLNITIHAPDRKKLKPFIDIEDYIQSKNKVRNKNKSNQGIFIDNTNNTAYIKFNGVSESESLIALLIYDRLCTEELFLRKIYEPNKSNPSSLLSKYILDSRHHYDFSHSYKFIKGNIVIEKEKNNFKFNGQQANLKSEIRNQKLYNTLVEDVYAIHKIKLKCAVCGLVEPSILEHCHIYEVSDIKKLDIAIEEKIKLANSGYNGIIMCKNHHELFDINVIKLTEDGFVLEEGLMKDEEYYNSTLQKLRESNLKTEILKLIKDQEILKYINKRNNAQTEN